MTKLKREFTTKELHRMLKEKLRRAYIRIEIENKAIRSITEIDEFE